MSINTGWKTRLALALNAKTVEIIDESWSILAGKERVHTVSMDNAFWNHLPHEFSLTFTTYQVLDMGPFLADLLNRDIENIEVVQTARVGDQWTFSRLGFSNGTISSIEGGNIAPGRVPTMVVTVEFLNWTFAPEASQVVV